MGQTWPNLIGALTIDYRGTRYALGRTADSYAIWEIGSGGNPLRTFPITYEGWAQAWAAYQAHEGPSATPMQTASWTRGQPITMQPMRVGQILDGAFKLYRLHFKTLVPLVALVIVPYELVLFLLILATGETVTVFSGPGFQTVSVFQPPLWLELINQILYFAVITPFLTAAVVKTASDAYLGEATSVGASYRAALPRIGSVLWVTILVALIVVACLLPGLLPMIAGAAERQEGLFLVGVVVLLVCVVPAVFLALRLLFAPPAVVVEGERGTMALRRAWNLSRGLGGKILGTVLLAALLMLAVGFVLSVPIAVVLAAGGGITSATYGLILAMNTLSQVLATPFYLLVVVLLYFDARIRKEGFDLAVMASQIGAVRPPLA